MDTSLFRLCRRGALFALLLFVALSASLASAVEPEDQAKSTTGPTRPRYTSLGYSPVTITGQKTVAGVPYYLWDDGCGPTAIAMVFGYWDAKTDPNNGRSFANFFPGSAASQTGDVMQLTASHGSPSAPRHYEDYAQDFWDPVLGWVDKSTTDPLHCHPDDCIADFELTSRSAYGLQYGWSRWIDTDGAIADYANFRQPTVGNYTVNVSGRVAGMSYAQYKAEIDANRPVVLLVDSNGDGTTDHFVTGVGYGTSGTDNMYACHDTWDSQDHWYKYTGVANGQAWGVYGGAKLGVRFTQTFSDVAPSFWSFNEIEACAHAGIVFGYGDGTYRPYLTINRADMAIYIARAYAGGDANVPPGPPVPHFSDVPTSHYAYKYIEYLNGLGIVGGFGDGTYRPTLIVDRGAMAVYVARAIVVPPGEASVPPGPPTPHFPDVTPYNNWAWCYKHVEYLYSQGVVYGYDGGLYHPEVQMTRDQMPVFIQRAFDVPMY